MDFFKNPAEKKTFFIKITLLTLFAGLCAYVLIHYDLYVYFTRRSKALELINSFHPYDAIIFIVLQTLQVVFAPIPGEATGLIGGFVYGPVLGTVYSTIGLTAGSWLAFYLARVFGLPFVEKAVNPQLVKKYDYVMEHQGALISFILFLVPGFPKDYLCYIMGLSHMKTATFLVISTTGRLFGTILLSVCGSYARKNQFLALFIALGISGIFALLAYLYREKIVHLLRKRKNP